MSKLKGTKKSATKKNGYKLPEAIPKGEVLTDIGKNQWRIGSSIGVGGFGEIYSASEALDSPSKSAYPFVIKIEPYENGPLFVEINFYMRVGKQVEIDEWCKEKKLNSFGMPRYVGFGTHECNSRKYRFLVMDRFARDLWSLFLENNKEFSLQTVLRIGYQVINTLEYIHNKGYVHADIKGANLLLGTKNKENQVYLVDFGMATKCAISDKPNPKQAHNGTPEYTSRDAHTGVMSLRGDLEILGYNMLHWLSSTLPWENSVTDVVKLQQLKEQYMKNIPNLMKTCFQKKTPPAFIVKYFEYITKLSFLDVLDYDHCRKLINSSLKENGLSLEGKLIFTAPKKTPVKAVKATRRKMTKPNNQAEDSGDETPPKKIRKQLNKWKAQISSSSSCDEEMPKKSIMKKETLSKPSWKDSPIMAVSNVSRPGEYNQVNGNSKLKKK